MTGTVLQVNFKLSVSRSEYEELASSLTQAFAEVPGLVWKIWIMNEIESEAGGIYYFDGPEALQEFLSSQLAADVRNHPAVSEFSAKTFQVMDAATVVTRGPMMETVTT
jgi:hypothetical protein